MFPRNRVFTQGLTLLVLIYGEGCASNFKVPDLERRAKVEFNERLRLLKKTPAQVLRDSVKKGDFRLFVIGGYVPEILIENPDRNIIRFTQYGPYRNNGFYEIINVADDKQMVETARKFAAKYNRLLVEYLDQHPSVAALARESNSPGRYLKNLLKGEPEAAVQKTIQEGYICFMGIGEAIPIETSDGTIERHMKDEHYLKSRYGVAVLISPSYYDKNLGILADEYEQLIEPARKFAAKYNRLLLEYLKEQESKQTKAH